MPKLSIIVPIYNVEPYIRRCLDSIYAQTFKDYEAILVNDGSTDKCGLIIDEYAQNDPRIITIHQQNKGVSAARNAGLRIAKGQYIGFVDPDDWIEPEMYAKLIQNIEANNCSIASCSWTEIDSRGNENLHCSKLATRVMDGVEYTKHLFDMPPSISGSAWSKLFLRDVIQSGFSLNHTICEDNYFVAKCCINCKRAVYLDEPLYHVFLRNSSATREIPGKVVMGLPVRREIIEIMKNHDVACSMRAERVFLDQCITYSKRTVEEQYREIAIKEFLDYMKENGISVLKNRESPIKERVMYIYQYVKMNANKLTQTLTSR